jgi:hypothetical protein
VLVFQKKHKVDLQKDGAKHETLLFKGYSGKLVTKTSKLSYVLESRLNDIYIFWV